jgi:Flp pilus assembly protein TadG
MKNRALGSRKGSAMLEFALSALLLTTIFTGVFQFGYSMYVYNELVEAFRAGTRYASLAKISNAGTACGAQSAYTSAVQAMVVYGDPAATTGTSVAPGLDTSKVVVTVNCSGSGNAAAVPTSVTVAMGTGSNAYTVDAVVKQFTFSGKPSFTLPFFGQYCSSGSTC